MNNLDWIWIPTNYIYAIERTHLAQEYKEWMMMITTKEDAAVYVYSG